MRFQASAIEVLQETFKAYLINLFKDKDFDYYNDYY